MTTQRLAQTVRGAFRKLKVDSIPLPNMKLPEYDDGSGKNHTSKSLGYDENEIGVLCTDGWFIPTTELSYKELKHISDFLKSPAK